jgi:hypothetical protein
MMSFTYQQMIEAFPKLPLRERQFLRKLLEFQRGKRSPDDGWVPAEDLEGFHKKLDPKETMTKLQWKGFLEVTFKRFNGARYQVPYLAGEPFPSEDEINSRRLAYKGKPVPF